MKQLRRLAAIVSFLIGVSAFGTGAFVIADPADLAPAEMPNRDAATVQMHEPLGGNPLWGIPITELSATRDRPIFSPSRRPPPPAVVPVVALPQIPVATSKQPERPQLALLGTIVNGDDGFGIFMDQATAAPLRIRIGADHQGWILRQVRAQSATLQKGDESIELLLPRPASDSNAAATRPVAAPNTTAAALPLRQGTTTRQAAPFLSPESASLQMPGRRVRSSIRPH